MVVNILLGLVIFIFFINPLFGILVFTVCDDKNQSLKKWIESCPKEIDWFMVPLTYSAWPVAIKWWLKNRKDKEA